MTWMALSARVSEPNRLKGDWLIPPGPWRSQSLLLLKRLGWGVSMFTAGADKQLEAVLVRGSSRSHIPQQHRSGTHFGGHPIKSEPQCLNVPRVALKHLEAPQPKKAHQSGSFRAWLCTHVVISEFSFLHPAIWQIHKSNVTRIEQTQVPAMWMLLNGGHLHSTAGSLQHSQSAPWPSSGVRWLMSNRKQPLRATEFWETLAYGAVQKEIWTKTCWMQKTKTRNKKKGKT